MRSMNRELALKTERKEHAQNVEAPWACRLKALPRTYPHLKQSRRSEVVCPTYPSTHRRKRGVPVLPWERRGRSAALSPGRKLHPDLPGSRSADEEPRRGLRPSRSLSSISEAHRQTCNCTRMLPGSTFALRSERRVPRRMASASSRFVVSPEW